MRCRESRTHSCAQSSSSRLHESAYTLPMRNRRYHMRFTGGGSEIFHADQASEEEGLLFFLDEQGTFLGFFSLDIIATRHEISEKEP